MSTPAAGPRGNQRPAAAEGEPEPELKIWNCLNCRKRKIRCDRKDPCAHCTRSELYCSFPVTGRTPTRRLPAGQRSEDTGWKARQRELLDKLSHLETVVKKLQTQESGPGSRDEDEDEVEDEDEDEDVHREGEGNVNADELGMLVSAKTGSLYVDNGFWAALCDEVSLGVNHGGISS